MKRLMALLLAGVMTFGISACAPSEPTTEESTAPSGESSAPAEGEATPSEPVAGGTLNVGVTSAPVGLNVWTNNDNVSATIMDLVVPHPIQMDANGTKIPYAIESFEMNEDATQYTVHIKEDLTWSDGTPVTSEDFKFTVEYCMEHSLSYVPSMYGMVESMETPDEKTIVFNLDSANVNFFNAAGYWVGIMPKAVFESVDAPMDFIFDGTMGYGPYIVDEHVAGEYVTLTKNPHYTLNNGEGAMIENIVFRVFSDENAMVLALKNGEIDVTGNFMSVAAQNQFSSDANFGLYGAQSLGYGFVTFSQSNELLTDTDVRVALSMTMDREAICAIAYQGAAVPMYTPISPVWQDFVQADIQQPAFDLDAANALLEEAGYVDTDGDGIREKDGQALSFTLTCRSDIAMVDSVIEIIRANAMEAGVEIVPNFVDAATYSANVTIGHDYDISYSTWGTIDDVDTTLNTIYGIGEQLNFMEYNNEEMDNLLKEAASELVFEERVKIIDEWQTLFVENMPTANLFVNTNTYIANTSRFDGWEIIPGNYGLLNVTQICNVYAK